MAIRAFKSVLYCLLLLAAVMTAAGQATPSPPPATNPDEDIPVLVQHLPNWESVQKQAKYVATILDR
jgi:hypothetical protein